jgi:hypothetical protein
MKDIAEVMESQFVFYTPIFMYNVLISDSLSSPTVQFAFSARPNGFFDFVPSGCHQNDILHCILPANFLKDVKSFYRRTLVSNVGYAMKINHAFQAQASLVLERQQARDLSQNFQSLFVCYRQILGYAPR